MTREIVCIACPIGCRLTVSVSDREDVTVTGNRCPRGDTYGREEILAPRRVLTAAVPTDSPSFPCAPVRTDRPIRRELLKELLKDLYSRKVNLPIRLGQVLIGDFDGARVLFTRTLPPDEVSPVGETGAKTEGEDEVAGLQ